MTDAERVHQKDLVNAAAPKRPGELRPHQKDQVNCGRTKKTR
jgi:hypothetical protein